MHQTNYEDVDGDGLKEMLVQKPVGAHGSELKIYVWRKGKYKERARLNVGTPVGFEFGDYNGDGRIEIKTEEVDWNAGLPYVSAPRLGLLFVWDGNRFVKVART